jgi:osmoprotectant transport system permease protein
LPLIWFRIEHIVLVGVSVAIAILTGVPVGIFIMRSQTVADRVLYVAAAVFTRTHHLIITRKSRNCVYGCYK